MPEFGSGRIRPAPVEPLLENKSEQLDSLSVDAEIPKVTIPDFTLDITAGPGTGKVSVRELNITKFNSPKFEFSLGDDGLSWSSMRGAVWESGWVQVLAVDIRVNVSARLLGRYDRPQIEIGRCTADVLYFDFEIGGGVIPWLVNLFRDDISKVIKQAIHNQACDTARSILLVQFNDFLMTLPLHVPIGNNFYVDYAVDRNITYTRQFVEAELLADVVYGTDSCHLQHVEPWDGQFFLSE
ncbi:unnamed protein product [Nippostrongylus brasiliensis]|uniref:BPI1 domain-containing protein n=1 Tax=Nippostrongylus brasiliensis TaxID=27835 RepID=A0A0N4Y427_NIPBR|nr:unnamed protein product [Nippostrongylus brasiliensis]